MDNSRHVWSLADDKALLQSWGDESFSSDSPVVISRRNEAAAKFGRSLGACDERYRQLKSFRIRLEALGMPGAVPEPAASNGHERVESRLDDIEQCLLELMEKAHTHEAPAPAANGVALTPQERLRERWGSTTLAGRE